MDAFYKWSNENKKSSAITIITTPTVRTVRKLMEEMSAEEYDKYHDKDNMFKGTKEQAVAEARQAALQLSRDKEVNIRTINDECLIVYGTDRDQRNNGSSKAIFIYIVYVTPSARGKGYAGKLIRHVIKEWNDIYRNSTKPPMKLQITVFKVNKNAIMMYEHLGFEICYDTDKDTHWLMEYKEKNKYK